VHLIAFPDYRNECCPNLKRCHIYWSVDQLSGGYYPFC
jgi:hypothetical protein